MNLLMTVMSAIDINDVIDNVRSEYLLATVMGFVCLILFAFSTLIWLPDAIDNIKRCTFRVSFLGLIPVGASVLLLITAIRMFSITRNPWDVLLHYLDETLPVNKSKAEYLHEHFYAIPSWILYNDENLYSPEERSQK